MLFKKAIDQFFLDLVGLIIARQDYIHYQEKIKLKKVNTASPSGFALVLHHAVGVLELLHNNP